MRFSLVSAVAPPHAEIIAAPPVFPAGAGLGQSSERRVRESSCHPGRASSESGRSPFKSVPACCGENGSVRPQRHSRIAIHKKMQSGGTASVYLRPVHVADRGKIMLIERVPG